MRQSRPWLRWLLAVFAIVLLAALLAATWLVTTEAGLRRAVTLRRVAGDRDSSAGRRAGAADRPAAHRCHRARAPARLDPRRPLRGGLRAARNPRRPDLRGRRASRRAGDAARSGRTEAPAVVHAGLAVAGARRCQGRAPLDRLARRHGNPVREHPRVGQAFAHAHRVQGRARSRPGLGRRERARHAARARTARARRTTGWALTTATASRAAHTRSATSID